MIMTAILARAAEVQQQVGSEFLNANQMQQFFHSPEARATMFYLR